MDRVLFKSTNGEWETPQEIFRSLHEEFGFTVDGAASHKNHLLPKYWTEEENSLVQDWDNERVWINPPYGRGIGIWIKKMAESKGLVVALLPARTDTKWFHQYIWNKAIGTPRKGVEVRFIEGRLKFRLDGKELDPAPFPSMIVVFNVGV